MTTSEKIVKLTTRELTQKSKNAKITVRENNGLYSIPIVNTVIRCRGRYNTYKLQTSSFPVLLE